MHWRIVHLWFLVGGDDVDCDWVGCILWKTKRSKQGLCLGSNYHVWLEYFAFTRESHPQRPYQQLALGSWLKIIAPIHRQEGVLFPYCLYLFHLVDTGTMRLRITSVHLLWVAERWEHTLGCQNDVKASTTWSIYPPLSWQEDSEIREGFHEHHGISYFNAIWDCAKKVIPACLLCCNICNSHSRSASTREKLDLIAVSTYSMNPSPSGRRFWQWKIWKPDNH